MSHWACSGRSVRNHQVTNPRITAGIPSSRNSHCQPANPHVLFVYLSSAPEIGPFTTPERGDAIMNQATARARFAGNQ